jgi:hypothetical protein
VDGTWRRCSSTCSIYVRILQETIEFCLTGLNGKRAKQEANNRDDRDRHIRGSHILDSVLNLIRVLSPWNQPIHWCSPIWDTS